MKELKRLNKYFLKYKYFLLLGVFITFLARIFSLVTPEYVEESLNVVEQYLKSDTKEQSDIYGLLRNYILIIIGSALISGFFAFWMRQTIIKVSRFIEYDLKNDIFEHYQKLCLTFYKNNRVGDLMNRISEDVNRVRMYTGPAIMYSVQTLTLFLCIIPMMFYTSVQMAIYTLIPLPILSYLIYRISKSIHRRTTKVQEFLSDFSVFSQETFSGISIIKSYNIENNILDDVGVLAETGRKTQMNLVKVHAWFFPLMMLLIGVSGIFVIYIGGSLYIDNEIDNIGIIAKFSIYVIMLTWPVATVGWISSIIQQATASQKRINAFLNQKPTIQNNVLTHTPISGDIVLKDVSLTYKDTQIKALNHINLTIKEGQTTAFIGKVGSGKSSIINLLLRLYDPDEGEILIGNRSLPALNLNDLRGAISIVPQDTFLFSDTIKNNITFAKKDVDDNVIINVAKKAVIHDNITQFKHGYNTILGERGITLSGGQKQRLAIARAILKDSPIFILDDCLSAVDTETESLILDNITPLTSKKTTIIASHRISTIKHADNIVIMDNGNITDQGTHDSLLEKNTYYKYLCDNQS